MRERERVCVGEREKETENQSDKEGQREIKINFFLVIAVFLSKTDEENFPLKRR